ncbi:TonB-dependent receptor plug domain-containing protein [Flavobacteriaceae bacterium TP-CH-4]|uniref:TonB-dependent receptor plug domain-containing protein n=1 Tax=Pelagihabitans pacificus TaxID=2696054 RepID=A0A967AW33_9FLAO|nr:TonB-dependent receptor [Pelagihabitans pacificus]NHF58662.1 TonB-dependent receptor plug domain-containing protein [Pelagihabitans pacificus]
MKFRITFVFFVFLSIFYGSAQQGTVSGTVNDGEFNDVLPFANVLVKGSSKGTTSDFDGKYTLNLEPGTYTIVYSFLGYETKEITEVNVNPGSETIVDVTLNPASSQLDEVVVVTTASKNTEASVLNLQKRSVALLDGLSIQSIKRSGASDIASAVKSVPGVSVQGGKFVYVRGLGDRYTKSILNGVDVPGLDPDRNTLQLDIFPTNILDNIIVVKSSTADQPADFTGGVVDIVTKDLPTKEEYSISLGVGYNSTMHFNNDYLSYEGSDTDFLGFDDGLRDLPIQQSTEIPIPAQDGVTVRQLTRRFESTLAAQQEQSLMNFNFGFTAGNQYNLNEDGTKRLGYLASISYRNTTEFYEDYINGQVFRKDDQDRSVLELIDDRTQIGDLGINSILLNGLAGISLKTEQSKYKLNVLHIQNGESNASYLRQENFSVNSNVNFRDVLVYTERSITNVLLNGLHTNQDASWSTEWKIAPTLSRIYDKDFRVTPFLANDNGTFTISPSEAGDPTRIWRDLQEINLAGKLDITRKHQLFGRDAKLKFGGAYTYKQRDFVVDQFAFPVQSRGSNFSLQFGGDADQVLALDNIYALDTGEGTYVRRDSNISDTFDSEISVSAAYLSEEFKLSSRLNAILGVRMEMFDLKYTGERQDGTRLEDEQILDKTDFFPSANFIYDLNEDANKKVRASYSRTTARPSFKEASIAEIFDPVSSTFFIGNIDIQPTYINNYDIRFESYGEGNNFFAVSGFYKTFDDPIEVQFIREARGQFRPLNLGDAKVFGAELEIRRNLGFIPGWEDFNLNANISIIESQQNFSENEEDARRDNLREGETLDDNRQLQGQSPYLINFGVNYDNEDNGWQAGLFYNVQGETLEIVGNGDIPDVFTQPFHNLKLNFSKEFGKEIQHKISLNFSNILNDDIESFYKSFGAEDRIFSFRSPGQTISLGYSMQF